jgi:hypothetical protein
MLPELFTSSDKEIQQKIIEIGTYIFFNGLSLVNDKSFKEKETFYESQLQQLKLNYDKQILDVQKSYDKSKDFLVYETKDSMEHLINEKDQYIAYFKDQIEILENKHEQNINEVKIFYDNLINNQKKRITDLELENIKAIDVSLKLDNLIGKKSSIDNATKGDFGENVVYNQILQYFPYSVIEDTSGETAKGDMLWKLNNNSFKALVEVKNVQYVRINDVEKFERDIHLNISNGSCNSAIFISLKTDIIQSKGSFHFEFFNECPVIYVSNVFQDANVLKLALNILYNLQTTIQSNSESLLSVDEKHIIQDYLNTSYNSILTHKQNIDCSKNITENLLNNLINQQNIVNKDFDNILKFSKSLQWSSLSKQIDNTKIDKKRIVIDAIKKFNLQNNRWPTTNEIVADNKNINKSFFRGNNSMNLLRKEIESSF